MTAPIDLREMRRVQRTFRGADGELFQRGQIVDCTNWPRKRGLINAGYLALEAEMVQTALEAQTEEK